MLASFSRKNLIQRTPFVTVYGSAASRCFSTEQTGQEIKSMPMFREEAREKMLRRKELFDMFKEWKLMVGFDFHVQIKSQHKMFSSK